MADSGAKSSKIFEWIVKTTITSVSPAHKDEGECSTSGGTHSGKPKGHNATSTALELSSRTLHIVHEDSDTALFMHDACKDV
jgi:hypothetical protein